MRSDPCRRTCAPTAHEREGWTGDLGLHPLRARPVGALAALAAAPRLVGAPIRTAYEKIFLRGLQWLTMPTQAEAQQNFSAKTSRSTM